MGAHVLELVVEFDVLGNGNAVFGNTWRAERLVEHDVAALWTKSDLHGIGENVDAAQHTIPRIYSELDFFS
ncbi:hypothetical protein XF30_11080 [Bradyrhizobium sp. SUTN9-2]|nr:hypothetical protein XF30_11080 [Bradyrhizobium sp. SUTN9-2]